MRLRHDIRDTWSRALSLHNSPIRWRLWTVGNIWSSHSPCSTITSFPSSRLLYLHLAFPLESSTLFLLVCFCLDFVTWLLSIVFHARDTLQKRKQSRGPDDSNGVEYSSLTFISFRFPFVHLRSYVSLQTVFLYSTQFTPRLLPIRLRCSMHDVRVELTWYVANGSIGPGYNRHP